mmetsp:Transcript_40455/g.86852  ORF Transcript_40455/g.86852 Transcript_40455/m.86852 type:complete len:182 (-) Transcript_40455:17-562(-)
MSHSHQDVPRTGLGVDVCITEVVVASLEQVPALHLLLESQQTWPHNFVPPGQHSQTHFLASRHFALGSLQSIVQFDEQQQSTASPLFLTPFTTEELAQRSVAAHEQALATTVHLNVVTEGAGSESGAAASESDESHQGEAAASSQPAASTRSIDDHGNILTRSSRFYANTPRCAPSVTAAS